MVRIAIYVNFRSGKVKKALTITITINYICQARNHRYQYTYKRMKKEPFALKRKIIERQQTSPDITRPYQGPPRLKHFPQSKSPKLRHLIRTDVPECSLVPPRSWDGLPTPWPPHLQGVVEEAHSSSSGPAALTWAQSQG